MKKITKIFVLAIASMVALASCAKNEVNNTTTGGTILKAYFDETLTKTALNSNYQVVWSSEDAISAFDIEGTQYTSASTTVSQDGLVAEFSFNVEEEFFYAIFPADGKATMNNESVITTTLPLVQNAVAGGFDPKANLAISQNVDNTAKFYNGGTLIGFEIKNDNIKKIEFESNLNLAGPCYISIDNNNEPLLQSTFAETTNKVTLQGNFEKGKTYYAVVFPTDYSGLKMTFTREDGKTAVYTNSASLELSDLRNAAMTVFAKEIPDSKWQGGDLKPVEHTISWTGPSDWTTDSEKDEFSLTAQPYGYSVVLKKNNGGTSPTVNATAKDCRLYAKGTATISNSKEITKIIFNISTAGKKRLATITASVGTIATQTAEADMVVWTGKAKEVTFTVGDTADYGSEGSSKAGQLCFDSIDATYLSDGSEPEPEPTKYAITIAEGIVGGTVTASAAEAVENAEITLTATPATGYDFSSWKVTNTETSAEITVTDNKFTMPAADVNVSATFRKQTTGETWTATTFASIAEDDELVIVGKSGNNYYAMSNDKGTSAAPAAVSVAISGDDLSETPESNIIWVASKDVNGNITFYLSDEQDKWLYCIDSNNGVRVGTNTAKTFSLDNTGYLKHNGTSRFVGIYTSTDWRCYTSASGNIANQTFKFYVRKGGATKYSVTCATVTGGTLSASPVKATEGTTVELTATPATEYAFNNDWTVKGADETSITVTDGKFTMPAQNVTVSGSFTKKTYTITKTTATNGTYTVKVGGNEVEVASKGEKVTLAADPADGYKLDGFTVKETSSGNTVTVSNNSFTMPGAAVTVSATFSEQRVDPEYEGQGTLDDPYTVSDLIKIAENLGSGNVTEDSWYGVGIISSITEVSTQYGNATYIIKDKNDQSKTFTVYRGKYLDEAAFTSASQIAVNDEVVVYGKIKNHNGSTMEFDAGNYIASLKKAPYLTATVDNVDAIPAVGSTLTVSVNTNVASWNAVSNNSAFVISDKTATSFKVVVSENTSTTEGRKAKITVSATGVNPVEIDMTQLKAGGVVQHLTCDFENESTSYTGWVVDKFAFKQTNSNLSAHTGSYFGTTDGKTTGYLQTKEKIAAPQKITFYASKTSTNTTSSNWKVQYSANGTTWTDVGTHTASGTTRGSWTEYSDDLSSLSNVYIRIYYTGSTAVRAIDDVDLVY